MKKILHIIAQKPGNTGSGVFLNTLLKEADNYSQAVVAGISLEDSEYDFPHKIDFFPVIFETKLLPFPVIGMSDVMPYRSTKYSDVSEEMFTQWKSAFSTKIREAVDKFKPDVILSHHLWLLTSLVIELCPKIPVYAFCHNTGIRQMYLVQKFKDYVVRNIQTVAGIFALTEFQKEEIQYLYNTPKDKIEITGAGYTSAIFFSSAKPPCDDVKIVYCGKLSFAKGVLSLLKAYESIILDAELIMAGSGSGAEKAEIHLGVSATQKKITTNGAVSQKVLGNIFREGDIFVLPSFYEGLPLVVIEALACGMRVVVTDLPGLKDWIGSDINSSGMIEYVKLPELIGKDVPVKQQLPDFENRLKSALEKQIIAYKTEGNKNIKPYLKDKTWKYVFDKIENRILKDTGKYKQEGNL